MLLPVPLATSLLLSSSGLREQYWKLKAEALGYIDETWINAGIRVGGQRNDINILIHANGFPQKLLVDTFNWGLINVTGKNAGGECC